MTADPEAGALRRRDDRMIEGLSKDLALVSQRVELNEKAHDARYASIESGQGAIIAKLDSLAAQLTEPEASPAGRALAKVDAELRKDVDTHERQIERIETFQTELRTAIRLARAALAVAGLSGFAQLAAVVASVISR